MPCCPIFGLDHIRGVQIIRQGNVGIGRQLGKYTLHGRPIRTSYGRLILPGDVYSFGLQHPDVPCTSQTSQTTCLLICTYCTYSSHEMICQQTYTGIG